MKNIVIELGEGLGIAFNECVTRVDDENITIKPPEDLKRGTLLLVQCGDDGILMPFIKFEGEDHAAICFVFCYHTKQTGWVQLDLSSLPHSLEELQEKGGITCGYCKPRFDMSKYEE